MGDFGHHRIRAATTHRGLSSTAVSDTVAVVADVVGKARCA
ncbi:hypothetical protein SCOCK_50185 [Actinacidiphila cocklensis]|uniref:Uncharacterized protein n=1 Tax=Actinacidiphila cocklensis TaxID=887465 RepID=A0A9W4GTK5_9ACTN|nr:hypothetical protein SCOCK_50185 [Actinacidiphila cocklensis]